MCPDLIVSCDFLLESPPQEKLKQQKISIFMNLCDYRCWGGPTDTVLAPLRRCRCWWYDDDNNNQRLISVSAPKEQKLIDSRCHSNCGRGAPIKLPYEIPTQGGSSGEHNKDEPALFGQWSDIKAYDLRFWLKSDFSGSLPLNFLVIVVDGKWVLSCEIKRRMGVHSGYLKKGDIFKGTENIF